MRFLAFWLTLFRGAALVLFDFPVGCSINTFSQLLLFETFHVQVENTVVPGGLLGGCRVGWCPVDLPVLSPLFWEVFS